jgi:DNA-binding CsgD family transcriptional regulator
VIVAVDDAHLLDDGSAALVLHLATATSARLVLTVRSGEPCPDAVTALWKDGLAERVELQPLAEAEVADLVERSLGGPLDAAARDRLWALTQGTPLYLREVVRAATDQGVLAEDGGTWRWRGALSGSDRLAELMRDRLAGAGADVRRVVELLAFGEPLPLALLDEMGHRDAAGAAEADGFVVLDGPPEGVQVRLAHPLYGELLRASVPELSARGYRRGLAAAALAVGWHDAEPLRVAVWALDGGAADDVPGVLVAAAHRALALSEWALAERLSRAAVPADPVRATLTLAIALTPSGRWPEASALLAALPPDALAAGVDGQVAGEATRALAWMLLRRGEATAVADVLAEAEGVPAALRPAVLVQCGFQAVLAGRPTVAVALAEAATAATTPVAVGTAPSAGVSELEVQVAAVVAFARALEGRADEALALAEPALPAVAGFLAADPIPGNPVGALPPAYCLALVMAGRIGEAADIGGLIAAGVADGPRALQALSGSIAGRMDLFAGRLASARRRADAALAACLETRQLGAAFWPAATLASAAGQLGDAGAAERAIAVVDDLGSTTRLYGLECDLARGWALAARGEVSAARARAVRTAESATRAGVAALALLALHDLARFGDPRTAAERLASAAAGAPAGSYAALVVAHVDALVAGDGAALDAVSRGFEGAGALVPAAEAAAAAAQAHAAAGLRSSAAAALGRARVLAARCDGARTPGLRDLGTDAALASLTDREREVVALAVAGLTNREVADRLYVSVRTVNTHLYRAYAKLGVNDRAQLAPIVSPGPPAPG